MNTLTIKDRRNTDKSLFEFLLSVPGFNMLCDEEMEMLEKIMRVDNYASGHKFKSADNIYLIIDGEVAVTHRKKGGTLQLDRIHTGEFFGLYALIDSSKRSAKCTAAGSVRAASLPRTAFELLFRSNLALSFHFQHILTNQVVRDMRLPIGSTSSYAYIY